MCNDRHVSRLPRTIRFRKAIEDLVSNQSSRSDIHPHLILEEHEVMESQLSDFVTKLTEYERFQLKSSSVLSVNSFSE
ncbi:MAG: hypothetical protein F4Z16_04330 [Rhodothermaceae bacterium]|nr:hypothetical protein [Rhodothermaceae bacterium]